MANVVHIDNFIGGKFVTCCKNVIESIRPSNGVETNATVPDSDPDEVDMAVKAAVAAFPGWKAKTCQERAAYLLKAADLLEERLLEFASSESDDQGKPVWLAKAVDIPRAVLNLRHFAHTVPHLMGTSKVFPGQNLLNYTTREPIGVAGLISPWNLPLYLLTFKLAPALMCGNTVVAKPSELTSVTAYMLCKIFQEVELPAGVLNMVFGYGHRAGAALTAHPSVPVISFTGSTATGAAIATTAAPLFKKLSLEMGGKNAAIVYSDCNIDQTVSTLIKGSFINQGQVCLCTSRIYVHKDIFSQFLDKFVHAAKALTIGDPGEGGGSFLGALNSGAHLSKVRGCVQRAVQAGATVHCGYTKDDLTLPQEIRNGFYMAATVLTGMASDAECVKEEIFGPVTCVMPFSTDSEAISAANSVRYGLCAAVFTRDLSRAHRTANELQAGTIWTNCWLVRDLDLPFGGMKQSGTGREGTHESWDFYTEQKTVCVQLESGDV